MLCPAPQITSGLSTSVIIDPHGLPKLLAYHNKTFSEEPRYTGQFWDHEMSDDNGGKPSSSFATADELLLAAVKVNDINATRAALAAGASANAMVEIDDLSYAPGGGSERSTTPALYTACENGNEEIVALLLAHGANPNAYKWREGVVDHETITCINASLSNRAILTRLLQAGANADIPNTWGEDRTTNYYPLDNARDVEGGTEVQALLRLFGAKKSFKDGTA